LVIKHHVDSREPADDVTCHAEDAATNGGSSSSSSEVGLTAAVDETRLTAAERIV